MNFTQKKNIFQKLKFPHFDTSSLKTRSGPPGPKGPVAMQPLQPHRYATVCNSLMIWITFLKNC